MFESPERDACSCLERLCCCFLNLRILGEARSSFQLSIQEEQLQRKSLGSVWRAQGAANLSAGLGLAFSNFSLTWPPGSVLKEFSLASVPLSLQVPICVVLLVSWMFLLTVEHCSMALERSGCGKGPVAWGCLGPGGQSRHLSTIWPPATALLVCFNHIKAFPTIFFLFSFLFPFSYKTKAPLGLPAQ